MSAKTSWTLCFLASLAAFCYLIGTAPWFAVLPVLFMFASFGFLYNRGLGVSDGMNVRRSGPGAMRGPLE